MKKALKVLVEILLLIVCALLVVAIVKSVMKPVNFNKQKDYRESIAIQRLKDIRTLQVAYKSVNGKFCGTVDSLKLFYENGKMPIVMQVGSMDDSVAVMHTEAVKKAHKGKMTPEDWLALYMAGDKNLVFSVESKMDVKDTLFASREKSDVNNKEYFNIDSLKYIPFSGGEEVQMESVVKQVSGVPVPLFEAKMPYKSLLKGLDNQLRINLDAEKRDQNRYEGLQVGSISAPNNNAGNWE